MVITRSGRLSFPEQPVTAAAAPVAVEAIVPLVQAPGNEAPIPILPIVQAPMAPPIQAPAIPVPGAAAQVVGAQATVDDQVQDGPASNATTGSANRSRTTTTGSKVKSVSGRSSAGMVAFPNNTGSLSKNNRQNSTGSVWSSGASGSQSGTQRPRSNGQGGSKEVGVPKLRSGVVVDPYLSIDGTPNAEYTQMSPIEWAKHGHGCVLGSSYVLKRNSDRQLYFSINSNVDSTDWFSETEWPRMDLGGLVLLEELPLQDQLLDAIGMVQFLRSSIYEGWQRSMLQYTCSTRIFFDVLRDGQTSDHNLNLCLQEIYALRDEYEIYLVAAHGKAVLNYAEFRVGLL